MVVADTLYAFDRDVFLFLVDDAHPIEAGRLPNGDPDLYFRGFYYWNSEVGSKTLGMASFYLRAVCMNRNIWGAEGFEEISIHHSKFASHRFAHQAAAALEQFAMSSPAGNCQRFALASGRFAMIDDGLGFHLVPWSPSLEKQLGRHVSGLARSDGGIDWSFGRKRGLGL